MGVPAGAAGDGAAAHSLVTTDDVFEGAGEDMMKTGAAVGAGGAFIKNKSFAFFGLSKRFLKNIVFSPKIQNGFFNGGERLAV